MKEKNVKFDKKILLAKITKNIKELRNKHNYTQDYVANELDINLTTYQKYESKKPYNIRISYIYLIAKFYKVSIDSLLQ